MKVKWTSPTNIALVKYWGKYGVQLPMNPSLSFTLKHSHTALSIEAHEHTLLKNEISTAFFFENVSNEKFKTKIDTFLKTQLTRFPWLLTHHLTIHSMNTFPHSSGIASSASSMSALCLSLLSLDEGITGKKREKGDFFKEASELSRLASGSASRSVYEGLVVWGELEGLKDSSNQFAIKFEEAHPLFKDYCDSILIVDDGEKSVSSRAGHGLMEHHPFKDQRYLLARKNLKGLMSALVAGDLSTFIEVVEEEALMLHALMMTSRPSYILLKGQSLSLIEKIRKFREDTSIPVCFTIDAGPNIHLLYPSIHKKIVREWIEKDLVTDLVAKKWIHDEVGMGPCQIEVNL
jgi:diphosphomevalonate decarboxylase